MLIKLTYIIDIFFVIDLIVNFLMCYYSYSGKLVSSLKGIFKHYLLTWFLFDLTAILPIFRILQAINGKDYTRFFGYNRLIRIIRFSYKVNTG